ncbi:carboxymuconolactone decarboxylase [Galdieria sulphuraria]|uniref:Carboxymuconolactone decarboxylase n=1 Tax=Galdieria sulphuraria TaxID=130081 RepID=M2Y3B3_GALSU|nr:carboxymuconolactone decarboxylase [Galdieria sulphuraria]EME30309.1 carboxymuconolactone decarboxylase [Galdieria sulphuraria]|eukprot:XP_005706829.1 carboxymuconolactone decarboxylase [Galdieria sulphuraria]
MPLFPSLTEESGVLSCLVHYRRDVAGPLIELHERILRGPSVLTSLQRELIGAFVSAVNRCDYSTAIRISVARGLGANDQLCEQLLSPLADNVDELNIEPEMKPLLWYVRKLTLRPETLQRADVEAVLSAGWDEQVLMDAMLVCCLYNFMDRLSSGIGLSKPETINPANLDILVRRGYRSILDDL